VSTLSIEFDRAVARVRITGNDRLADRLERLRPHLHLRDGDSGKVWAGAAQKFSQDFYDLGKELKADPCDMLLMLSGVVANTLNLMQRDGLAFGMGMYALIKHLESVSKRIEEAMESGEIGTHER
jgi:hypothetical protein